MAKMALAPLQKPCLSKIASNIMMCVDTSESCLKVFQASQLLQ